MKRNPRVETAPGAVETKVETKKRAPRVPMQKGGTLDVNPSLLEKGYYHYWGIDKDQELEKMQMAYFEFVLDENGQKITKPAGRGETHYLMRLPMEYRQEDIVRRRLENNRIIEAKAAVGSDEYGIGTGGRAGEGSALRQS